MTSRASIQHQRERAELTARTARAARDAWSLVSLEDIRGSWAGQLGRLIAVVLAAQLVAAGQSEQWLRGIRGLGDPVGRIRPEAFTGASDGRDLAGLLMYPAWVALHALTLGVLPNRALARGATWADFLVKTQVADAGRAADSVAMVARPEIAGHERVVHVPACSRCVILAGRLYRWSTGFERHPGCDCTMEPVTREQWRDARPENNPRALFDQMTPEQQRKSFGVAAAQAIADGADFSQVVNARRGMTTATAYGRQVQTTREGITRRGVAGARLAAAGTTVVSEFTRSTRLGEQRVRLRGARTPRLMPEEIYRQADDREHALHLLRMHGYIL
jgi:hypothetical protein